MPELIKRPPPIPQSRLCPHCEWPMTRERVGGPHICKICKSEFAFTPLPTPQVAPEIRKVQEMVDEDELGTVALVDVSALQLPRWKQLVTLLGCPVEESDFPTTQTPWGGLIFVGLCVALYFASTETQLSLSLYQNNPSRYFGFNFLSHSLVHNGFMHLAFNLLFVSPFIDSTEEDLGTLSFIKLIFLSALFSGIAQHLFEPFDYVLMGASGVFLGISTYYCLRFPQRRFLVTVPFLGIIAFTKRIRIRAWILILGYFIIEVLNLRGQLTGQSNTSHLAHLGGVAAGALFYFFTNRSEQRG